MHNLVLNIKRMGLKKKSCPEIYFCSSAPPRPLLQHTVPGEELRTSEGWFFWGSPGAFPCGCVWGHQGAGRTQIPVPLRAAAPTTSTTPKPESGLDRSDLSAQTGGSHPWADLGLGKVSVPPCPFPAMGAVEGPLYPVPQRGGRRARNL